MNPSNIISNALVALESLTGIKGSLIGTNKDLSKGVKLEKDGTTHVLKAETKSTLKSSMLPFILDETKTREGIIIAKYISQPLKEELRQQGINYLDIAGNCFINIPNLFVYINDQKIKPTNEKTDKLWKDSGLKFLFSILSKPDLLNQPYRTISEKTGVSLGAVSNLVKELKTAGFAIEILRNNKQQLKLEHIENLIDQWTIVFNAHLRPKLFAGRYKSMLKIDLGSLAGPDNWWGGEAAAALVTKYLVPQVRTIYIRTNTSKAIKKFKLIPDKNGDIELMEAFWEYEPNAENSQNQSVPNLIIYADLLSTNDSRNKETAQRIKEKILSKL